MTFHIDNRGGGAGGLQQPLPPFGKYVRELGLTPSPVKNYRSRNIAMWMSGRSDGFRKREVTWSTTVLSSLSFKKLAVDQALMSFTQSSSFDRAADLLLNQSIYRLLNRVRNDMFSSDLNMLLSKMKGQHNSDNNSVVFYWGCWNALLVLFFSKFYAKF